MSYDCQHCGRDVMYNYEHAEDCPDYHPEQEGWEFCSAWFVPEMFGTFSPERRGMTTLDLYQASKLVLPVMLAQAEGEISESCAAELLGIDIVSYREFKHQTIAAFLEWLEKAPNPFLLFIKEHVKGTAK